MHENEKACPYKKFVDIRAVEDDKEGKEWLNLFFLKYKTLTI